MRGLARWILTGAVVAFVGSSALAQRPQQPGGQPGQPGGGGGFGASLALGSGLKARLLDNKDLQDEIKLTDDQKTKIKQYADKAAEDARPTGGGGGGGAPGGGGTGGGRPGGGGTGGGGGFGGGGFGGFGGARSDEEQIEALKKQIAGIEARVKFFKDTLTADQTKRIGQLETQQLGLRAFTSEKIVTELKLTDEQKEAVKKINEEYNKETADLRKEYGLGGGFGGGGQPGGGGGARPDAEKMAEYTKKSKVLREEAQEKVEKSLTADQKKSWSGLIGTPFDVSKLTPQLGGGRGGN